MPIPRVTGQQPVAVAGSGQSATPPAAPEIGAFSASGPKLQKGSKGDEVKALQQALKDAGCDPGTIDGKFGPATEKAVKKFQAAMGLKQDGVVGPLTRKALAGVDSFQPATETTPSSQSSAQAAQGATVEPAKNPPQGNRDTEQSMIDYARNQVGKKYVLGSSGPTTFDCSGLTLRMAGNLGYNFYHGATTQWNRGHQSGDPSKYGYWEVSGTIDTMPNDRVVFLFNQDKETGKMSHTGVYDPVTGNVIQAGGYGGRGVHEGDLRNKWTHWAVLKAPSEYIGNTLGDGSRGAPVRELQQALISLGYDLGKCGPDGSYGRATVAAVKVFQGAHGLSQTGTWGEAEQAALLTALASR